MKFNDKTKVDLLVRMYREGKTIRQITKAVGISTCTVYSWLCRTGTPVRPIAPQISAAEVDRFVSLYESGNTVPSIQEDTGRAVPTILNHLRKRGVPIKPPGRPLNSGVVDHMTPEQYAAHVEKKYPGIVDLMRSRSQTMEEIGQRYGITRERVRQFENLIGLQPRGEIIHCISQIAKEELSKARQSRKEARRARWVQLGIKLAMMVEQGASKEELKALIPGTSKQDYSLANFLTKMRKEFGVPIPKRYWWKRAA